MIGIDTTFFGHEEVKKGVLSLSTSIFTADLLDGFAKLGSAKDFMLIVNFNHADFFAKRFPQYKLCIVKWFPVTLLYKLTSGKKTATKLIKKFGAFKKIVERQNFSAIWFPYAMNQTFVKTSLKSFATIHDIYRLLNGTKNEAKKFRYFLEDKTTSLVAISEYTKNDILKNTHCKKDISIIPNSIVMNVAKTSVIQNLLNTKYILDLNAYVAKKNPMTLLKAFSLIKDKLEHILVFCGGYKDDSVFLQMQNFIAEKKLENRVQLLYRVTDEERNFLLLNANLFITPSLFEGFGRTPVEAAICKIPVISTKETSLYEATMGLCDYVENPTDENELAKLILEKINNPNTLETLQQISDKLKQEYEITTCAKKYLNIFNNNVESV